jgi:hypothetical protein
MTNKKIETYIELQDIFNGKISIDSYKDSYPSLYVLQKFSSSFGYVNDFVLDSKNFMELNPELNKANEWLGGLSLVGLSIPVIGEVLALVTAIFGNISLEVYSDISKSNIAVNRFKEWTNYINPTYGKPINNILPSTASINYCLNYNPTLYNLVPKCISPSSNCSSEHKRFQLMIHLIRQSQEGYFEIYKNFVQGKNIQDFNNEFYYLSNLNIKTPIDDIKNPPINKAGFSFIGIIILLGIYFSRN